MTEKLPKEHEYMRGKDACEAETLTGFRCVFKPKLGERFCGHHLKQREQQA